MYLKSWESFSLRTATNICSLWTFGRFILLFQTQPAERGKQFTKMKLPMCALALNGFLYYTTVHVMQQENNPLIDIHCSCFTHVFVYLTHYLFCSTGAEISLLLSGHSVHEDVFNNFRNTSHLNLDWPSHLNCSTFPHYPPLCMKPSSFTPSPTSSPVQEHSSSTASSTTASPTLPNWPFQNSAVNWSRFQILTNS